MPKVTTVAAKPRILIALTDLGKVTERAYCGVGFSFDGPATTWELTDSDATGVEGLCALDEAAKRDIDRVLGNLAAKAPHTAFRAVLSGIAPQHSGFGSKTALLLGLLEGANRHCGLGLPARTLQLLSGRGGASGVGSHAFFMGGVVWDAGHPTNTVGALLPSSARVGVGPPPLAARWNFPASWRVLTFLPNDPKTAGAEEIRFFSQNTPLPPDEIDWTLRAIYHAVIPGFAIEDLGLLAAGLRALHERGFKERALVLRSQNTRDFLNFALTELGAAVGVSSLGPGVYAILHERDRGLRSELVAAGKKWGLPLHSDSPGWNAGHLVSSR